MPIIWPVRRYRKIPQTSIVRSRPHHSTLSSIQAEEMHPTTISIAKCKSTPSILATTKTITTPITTMTSKRLTTIRNSRRNCSPTTLERVANRQRLRHIFNSIYCQSRSRSVHFGTSTRRFGCRNRPRRSRRRRRRPMGIKYRLTSSKAPSLEAEGTVPHDHSTAGSSTT